MSTTLLEKTKVLKQNTNSVFNYTQVGCGPVL